MRESIPNLEFSGEELRLIDLLKTKGAEDAETHEMLLAWIDAGQAQAAEKGNSRANIEFNLRWAKLYKAAGLEDARKALEDVIVMAENEGEQDLYNEAERLLDELEKEPGGN